MNLPPPQKLVRSVDKFMIYNDLQRLSKADSLRRTESHFVRVGVQPVSGSHRGVQVRRSHLSAIEAIHLLADQVQPPVGRCD